MRLETTAKLLAGALRNLVPVIERRTSIPILSCVLFAGKTIRGTDLDVDLSISVPASVARGKIAIDHRSLLNLVRNIPADDTVRVEGGMEGATLTFSSGRYDLPTLPAGDFPELKSGETKPVEFDGDGLKKALAFASPFISTEETRYYLNGVCLDGDLAVATDVHRLGCAPMGAGSFERIILPRKPAMLMAGLPAAKSIEMSDGKPFMRWRFDGAVLSTKLIDAAFPDWRRVLPKDDVKTSTIRFDTAEILAAARRAQALCGTANGCTIAWGDGRVALVVDSSLAGKAREYLARSSATGAGQISFNIRYLISVASVFGRAGRLTATISDAYWPVRMGGEGEAFAVLMPLRLAGSDLASETLSQWVSASRGKSAA